MKATILITVLDSHEILRRQLLHFSNMALPDDIELLIIDDGSSPPLTLNHCTVSNARIHATNDFRPWTQQIARNLGAEMARGEYLICTDIDHILSRKLIDTVCEGKYDVVRFSRQFGILDALGRFSQSIDDLVAWGLTREQLERRGFRLRAHGNSYGIRRDLFIRLGGSRVDREALYPQRDEIPLKRKIKKLAEAGEIKVIPDGDRPVIYMMPIGRYCGGLDYNPFGLFHKLTRNPAEIKAQTNVC